MGRDRGPARFLTAAALTAVLAGCGSGSTGFTPRIDARPRDQVLSAMVDSGSSAVRAPAGGPRAYVASFGAFMLCSRKAGLHPVILGVTPHDGFPRPRSVRATVRVVDRRFIRAHPRLPLTHLIPTAFSLGSPPAFDESYAGSPGPGAYSRVEGFKVTTACPDANRADQSLSEGLPPSHPLAELMVTVAAGPSGAVVDWFSIEYQVGGKIYRLPVHWKLADCGTAVKHMYC